MPRRHYTIRLHVIVPLIFAGFVLLAYMLANWQAHGFLGPALGWGLLLAAGAFGVGLLLSRHMLLPVERFIQQAEQLPVMRAMPDHDDPAPEPSDEMARYDDVFRRLTHILSKVEADELFPAIVGRSRAMRGVMAQVLKVAETEAAVCIQGESGTGKELIAQNIHDHSPRRHKPLIKINCAAIPDTLMESELFGHEKGAFTGATSRKPGKFELAQGGTVLLDEIGDLPMALQGKLLRAIEEKEFERVGGTAPAQADVRFLAATNRDLEAMVAEGTFRSDLYYRITATSLHLPPLRERRDDITLTPPADGRLPVPSRGRAQGLPRGHGRAPGPSLARQRARTAQRPGPGPAGRRGRDHPPGPPAPGPARTVPGPRERILFCPTRPPWTTTWPPRNAGSSSWPCTAPEASRPEPRKCWASSRAACGTGSRNTASTPPRSRRQKMESKLQILLISRRHRRVKQPSER